MSFSWSRNVAVRLELLDESSVDEFETDARRRLVVAPVLAGPFFHTDQNYGVAMRKSKYFGVMLFLPRLPSPPVRRRGG